MDGSFVQLSPCDTNTEIGTELSIAFVCGQVSREIDNPNSNVNKLLYKLRYNSILENIVTLTLVLYDKSGEPLKQQRVVQRCISKNLNLNKDSFENPCYRHSFDEDGLQQTQGIDKDLVVSECMEVVRFLRRSKDIFKTIRKLRLVCFHYIDIPEDLRFMFNVSKRLEVIEKVNESADGSDFGCNDTGSQIVKGSTPWRFSLGI